ncbi:hypothetical protein [Aureivirga sp. CE67]|uniref:hypothetical protein n=1 Tax=Aureivirga sp. CE67 TaxID=1788983 RepID=UPI0018CBE4B5|nr:hypothetical protein [Aureivirga sp. CE67]
MKSTIYSFLTLFLILACTKKETPKFQIIGDFNGDKISESLFENKIKNETYEIKSSNSLIHNFEIPTSTNNLLLLENIGDLNQNGKDEVAIIYNLPDFSNLNSVHILEYKNEKWTRTLKFSFLELDLYSSDFNINNYIYLNPKNKVCIKKYIGGEHLDLEIPYP